LHCDLECLKFVSVGERRSVLGIMRCKWMGRNVLSGIKSSLCEFGDESNELKTRCDCLSMLFVGGSGFVDGW
jgi:hypothetical protein